MLALAAGLVPGAPGSSLADETGFVWEAPPGCPPRESVLGRVRQVAKRADGDGATAHVRVERTDDERWIAHVATGGGSSASERVLEAHSCEAIAEAAALIVGLSETTTGAAADPLPLAARRAAPPVASLRLAQPYAAAVHDGLLARASAAGNVKGVPSATPGFALGLAWRTPHVELALEGTAYLDQRAVAPGSYGATLGLSTLSFDVCLPVPLGDRAVMDACAGMAIERIAAKGFGDGSTFTPRSAVLTLFKPTGELGFEWWLSPVVALRGAARGLISVSRPPFVVHAPADATTPSAPVFRQDVVDFACALGVVVRLAK